MPLTVLPPKQSVSQLSLWPAGADLKQTGVALIDTDGRRIELPEEMLTLLDFVLKAWEHGHGVTLSVTSEMLTTQEAARWIGCSRQHVVSLMSSGVLPGRKIGTHRRIRLEDVLIFIENERKRQSKELGLPAAEDSSLTLPLINGQ